MVAEDVEQVYLETRFRDGRPEVVGDRKPDFIEGSFAHVGGVAFGVFERTVYVSCLTDAGVLRLRMSPASAVELHAGLRLLALPELQAARNDFAEGMRAGYERAKADVLGVLGEHEAK